MWCFKINPAYAKSYYFIYYLSELNLKMIDQNISMYDLEIDLGK